MFEDNRQDMFRRSPPVNEGESYDVKIESLGREGDGIARVNNFVIIIPNTQVGDKVKVRINKVARRVAFAEVLERLEEEEIIEEETEPLAEEEEEEEEEEIEEIAEEEEEEEEEEMIL